MYRSNEDPCVLYPRDNGMLCGGMGLQVDESASIRNKGFLRQEEHEVHIFLTKSTTCKSTTPTTFNCSNISQTNGVMYITHTDKRIQSRS